MTLKRVSPAVLFLLFFTALGLATSPAISVESIAYSSAGAAASTEETVDLFRVGRGRTAAVRVDRPVTLRCAALTPAKSAVVPATAFRVRVEKSLLVRVSSNGLGFPLLS